MGGPKRLPGRQNAKGFFRYSSSEMELGIDPAHHMVSSPYSVRYESQIHTGATIARKTIASMGGGQKKRVCVRLETF